MPDDKQESLHLRLVRFLAAQEELQTYAGRRRVMAATGFERLLPSVDLNGTPQDVAFAMVNAVAKDDPRSLVAFIDALGGVLVLGTGDRGVLAQLRATAAALSPQAPEPGPGPAGRPWPRRRGALVVLLVIVIVLGVAGVLIWRTTYQASSTGSLAEAPKASGQAPVEPTVSLTPDASAAVASAAQGQAARVAPAGTPRAAPTAPGVSATSIPMASPTLSPTARGAVTGTLMSLQDPPASAVIAPDNAGQVVEWTSFAVPGLQPGDMSIAPTGEQLAVNNGGIIFYSLPELTPAGEIKGPDQFHHGAAFAPDWSMVATMGTEELRLWNPATGGEVRKLDPITGFDYNYSDKAIALAHGLGLIFVRTSNMIHVLDAATGHVTKTLTPETGETLQGSMALSPDGKLLAASGGWGADKTVIWDTATWQPTTIEGGGRHLVFSPDGKRLASDTTDRLQVVDPAENMLVWAKSLPVGGRLGFHGALAFSPDGRLLASGHENGKVTLWDAKDGRLLASLPAHGKPIKDIVFAPNGTAFATAAEEETVRIWGLPAGKGP